MSSSRNGTHEDQLHATTDAAARPSSAASRASQRPGPPRPSCALARRHQGAGPVPALPGRSNRRIARTARHEADACHGAFLCKVLGMYSGQLESKHQGLGEKIAEACQEVYVTVREREMA